MLTLFHHPFCPFSRFVRLTLSEYGLTPRFVEERPWERRTEFLTLNPAGTTPVLLEEGRPPVPDADIIAEFLDETRGADSGRAPPAAAGYQRAHRGAPPDGVVQPEIRRRGFRRRWSTSAFSSATWARRAAGRPDMNVIRAALSNIRYHLAYIGWLVRTRDWLAGERMSYADLAAAAHLSSIDYLGDVPWNEDDAAKVWYARVKSRPSFRPLLAEDARRDCRRRRPTPTSTSERSAGNQERIDRAGRACAASTSSALRGRTPCPTQQARLEALPRRRRAWRHGLARRRMPSGAAIRARCGRDVRSVIMLGVNYGPDDEDPLAILKRKDRGAISVYAQSDDYHDIIKKRLKMLARWLIAQAGGDGESVRRYRGGDGKAARGSRRASAGRASTQISSRANSARGCFWGRSSPRLICRYDDAGEDHCGRCTACQDICPTQAFPRPTISMRGAASPTSPSSTRDRSRTNFARRSAIASMAATIAWRCVRGTSLRRQGATPNSPRAMRLREPRLADLARLDDAAFRALFAKTAVKRTGRDRFIRNVLIAIGNSGDVALAAEAERLLDDASPLVRGAAVWALAQLAPDKVLRLAAQHADESDESCGRNGTQQQRRQPRVCYRITGKAERQISWA